MYFDVCMWCDVGSRVCGYVCMCACVYVCMCACVCVHVYWVMMYVCMTLCLYQCNAM